MSTQRVESFVNIYQKLNKNNLHLLGDIYAPNIHFSDPLHEVAGLDDLHSYFSDLYSNVQECGFDITSHHCAGDNAFVYWVMKYRHPKLANNKEITVKGHSHLVFNGDKIVEHQDYFDVGALLYRNIPLVGSVIKFIDKRATQS